MLDRDSFLRRRKAVIFHGMAEGVSGGF
jgi:hypothetical protein